MAVGEGDGRNLAAIDGGEVDARPLHEPPAEGQPLRGVVVAANDEHGKASLRQTAEKPIKQRHRLGRGGQTCRRRLRR